jgi:hypothetical protein
MALDAVSDQIDLSVAAAAVSTWVNVLRADEIKRTG